MHMNRMRECNRCTFFRHTIAIPPSLTPVLLRQKMRMHVFPLLLSVLRYAQLNRAAAQMFREKFPAALCLQWATRWRQGCDLACQTTRPGAGLAVVWQIC
jgi:hypothetical protein